MDHVELHKVILYVVFLIYIFYFKKCTSWMVLKVVALHYGGL